MRARLALLLLSLLLCAACSQRAAAPEPATADSILCAPVPTGVDPQLWHRLTAELARVVAQRTASGKFASKAAQGRGSEVRDIKANPDINSLALVSWTYRCQGDYDLNGEVNISDLTPIAIHFGKRSTGDNLGRSVPAP